MPEYSATLMPGFGAGLEAVRAFTRAIDRTGIEFTYTLCDDFWDPDKPLVPPYALDAARRTGRVVTGDLAAGMANLELLLLRDLGVWARVMPLALPDTPMPVISPFSMGPETAAACKRVVSWTFAHAIDRGCATVTVASEEGLLADAARELAGEVPAGVALQFMSADAALAAVRAGATDLGMLIVSKRDWQAAVEAATARLGCAPALALGSGVVMYQANPLTAALLLWDVGEHKAAHKVWDAQA